MRVATLVCGALVMSAAVQADPLVERTQWQRSYPVTGAAPGLVVRNIWGDVKVKRGAPGAIVVSAVETRSARTAEALEKSREKLRLEVVASSEGLSLEVDQPNREQRMGTCDGCRLEYQFEISVPSDARVDVRTVTDGRVEVTGLRGPVKAGNVNGAVAVNGIDDCSSIDSVNGTLEVTFARAPSADCNLKTINGAIIVGLPADAGLDAVVDLGHGHIESEFEVEGMSIAPRVERSRQQDRWRYRLQQSTGLRVGEGGPTFTFASLNGDVHILKNK